MTNQQCHGTERQWVVNQVEGQSDEAQLLTIIGKVKNVTKMFNYSTMMIEDTEVLRRFYGSDDQPHLSMSVSSIIMVL